MNVCVCLDNNNGMLFNSRRQSRDKRIVDDLFSLVGETPVYIQPFSEKLFKDRYVITDEDILENAGTDAYCFIECCGISEYCEKINRIIVYRWNRDYPADFFFDVDLSDWEIIDTFEFSSQSHEKITREVYVKK